MPRLVILLLALTAVFVGAPARAADRPPVILVSLDGFRADYLGRGLTPTLRRMAEEGAWAEAGMRPSFPSNTFPNHYTLVTGMRPDRHGVIDNTMTDAARPGVKFSMSARDQVEDRFWWDGGEPIWVTAEKAGLRTATMFWPGSEAAVRGVRPWSWAIYDEALPMVDRVDRVLGWLDLPPAERPAFMTLYFEAVDDAGHDASPEGPEADRALALVDAALARLVAGLKARGLYDRVDIVIVADHGMAETAPERIVFLDDLLPLDSFRWVTLGSTAGLTPLTPEAEAILLGRHEHFECWRRARIPDRFHFGSNPRVPPVFCLADTGWLINTRPRYANRPMRGPAGSHGFDPYDPRMRALFVARGPSIRSGVRLPVFDNVSVYPLLAKLLGVTPAPNDGDPADTAAALR